MDDLPVVVWGRRSTGIEPIDPLADSVGQSYANHSDLNPGLQAWQQSLVDYGTQQGFKMNG